MPSWPQLLATLDAAPSPEKRDQLLRSALFGSLQKVSELRDGRNVIFYTSAFLQKPHAPAESAVLTQEDLHGFMAVMHGMDFSRGLTLILHTPGGVIIATETIVDYLRSKFPNLEVIIPTYAMSAGTMISLAADRIIMGRQSQLGPIDPQLVVTGRQVSAQAILDQFEFARHQVSADPSSAYVWGSILPSLGPSLLQEARYAVEYGQRVVATWLSRYMFNDLPNSSEQAQAVARHFGDGSKHLSHGRRINRDEARQQGLTILDLEDDQELQEATLTAYHAITILFEQGPMTKAVLAPGEKAWMKQIGVAPPPNPPAPTPDPTNKKPDKRTAGPPKSKR